jgi:hypothetical protein
MEERLGLPKCQLLQSQVTNAGGDRIDEGARGPCLIRDPSLGLCVEGRNHRPELIPPIGQGF